MRNRLLSAITSGGCALTSIVSSIDPFDDGNLIDKYELDGDTTSTTGGTDATSTGVTYETGTYGQCARVSGAGYIDTNSASVKSVSFYYTKKATTGVASRIVDARLTSGTGYLFENSVTNNFSFVGLTLKVDGVSVASNTFPIVIDTTYHLTVEFTTAETAIRFGADYTTTLYANSQFDQIELYDRVLTSQEIESLSTQSKYYCDPTPQDYIAYYPLTGTAEDATGNYDGTESSATYEDDADYGAVYNGGGSITIPSTGGTSCTYWKDTGSGFVFIYSLTIPSSLATDRYSRLRVYGRTLSTNEQDTIELYELTTRTIPVSRGLVTYYPLGNNNKDNYFNEYDCTDVGGVTYDGLGASYDGATYTTTPTSFIIDTTADCSFNIWAKMDSSESTGFKYFLGVYDSTPLNRLYIGVNNGKYLLGFGSFQVSVANHSFVVGTYGMLTLTFSSGTAKVYFNGVFVENVLYTGVGVLANHFFIAARNTNGGGVDNQFDGDISKLRVYDRAISTEEVDTIYQAEKGDYV
jgi:hypothetical protein